MSTKEHKILIKNVWESKKYGVRLLFKEFPNKKWSVRGVEDFLKRLRTTGSIERAPGIVDVRARRALLRTLTLCGTWYTEPGESTTDTLLHSTDLTRARNTSNK